LRNAAALLLAASLVQAGYEEVLPKGACRDSKGEFFNRVYKVGLGSGYLATCQDACDVIEPCIGITVYPDESGCQLNGEGLNSTDIAAAELASGSVGGWSYACSSPHTGSYNGSGGIAGTDGSSGYECHKKTVTTTITATTTTATNTTATTKTTAAVNTTAAAPAAVTTAATTTAAVNTTATPSAAVITTTAAPIAVSTASTPIEASTPPGARGSAADSGGGMFTVLIIVAAAVVASI